MRSVFALVTAFLAFAAPVKAVLLTYTFQGTIYSKTDPDHLVDGLNVGDTTTYVIQVDSNAPNSAGAGYWGLGGYDADSGSLSIGSNVFQASEPHIAIIANDSWYGPYQASSMDASFSTNVLGLSAYGYWRIVDYGKEGISFPGLPLSPYDLSLFEMREFSLSVHGTGGYPAPSAYLSGTFDSFTIVPEPAMSVGLLLGGFLLRRRGGRQPI